MKRVLYCMVLVACFGMPGCASTGSSSSLRAERVEIDSARVSAVNTLAQRRGVHVTWVNPPVKRVPADSGLAD